MLIEKKETVGINDVASIRLITGEELIGKVTAIDATSVTFSKPISIQAHMLPNGGAGIGFAPFMFSVPEDGSFVFKFDRLMMGPLKTRQDVSAQYIQATTNIAVPSAPGIIR